MAQVYAAEPPVVAQAQPVFVQVPPVTMQTQPGFGQAALPLTAQPQPGFVQVPPVTMQPQPGFGQAALPLTAQPQPGFVQGPTPVFSPQLPGQVMGMVPALPPQQQLSPAATPFPGGVPPLSSLEDEYSKLCDTRYQQGSGVAAALQYRGGGFWGNIYGSKLPYFDADELAKLSSQPPPVDHFLAGCNGHVPHGTVKVPKDVEAAPGSQPPSLAETFYGLVGDAGSSGVSSCDELLHEDSSGGEIMKFLNTFNSKPLWAVMVVGSHQERRTRRDSDGNEHTSYVTVEDFKYKVDISHSISPFGFITTDNDVTVEETIQNFLKDSNALKNLCMCKEVDFDFEHLQRMVHGYVRSLGWQKDLHVTLSFGNVRTVAYKTSCWTILYENWFTWFFCCILPLCIPKCIMSCIQSAHNKGHIKSYFRIDAHPIQVFESIKSKLGAGCVPSNAFW
ncbi:hypothetical protein TeGR_g2998 [Tetraparma gracilis]|uniref:Uncharacterized protein n=1 Tax=Tetraparma gracilis TaxID=2962635 RepID=A0ABQ6N366_9STRA|nr:hypothetical protein TeGR_g2998 [Tetraparma gracilis]